MINLIYSIVPVICFITGFYIGFYIRKEDKLPEAKEIISPVEFVEKQKKKKESEKKASIEEIYIQNINNYPNNQQKIKE